MSSSLSLSTSTLSTPLAGSSRPTFSWRFQVIDIISILTLLQCIYLTFAARNLFQFAILTKLLLLAALWPAFRRSSYLWLTVVASWIPTLYLEWCNHEDHIYFGIYWCAVLALATWRPRGGTASGTPAWHAETESFLRQSARYLIGLCFLFATLWKVVSPEFYDSSLFHYKLLCDDRFSETLARVPGGMSVPALQENYQAMSELRAPASVSEAASLQYTPRISALAVFMTWWTIAIEGLLALVFLWPASGRRLNLLRNLSLIGFALSTYVIAPVMGYGFTFMIMGYANCEPDQRRMRAIFLGMIVVLGMILIFRNSLIPAEIRDFRQTL